MTDPLFRKALLKLNPWVDVDDRQEFGLAENVAPGERPDQSDGSAVYMGKVRDAMALSMWSHL